MRFTMLLVCVGATWHRKVLPRSEIASALLINEVLWKATFGSEARSGHGIQESGPGSLHL